MEKNEQMPLGSSLNVIAGAWLIAAPFVLSYQNVIATWNDVILGFLIGATAFIHSLWATKTGWLSWLNIVFGFWLLASPFVLVYGAGAEGINDIVIGAIVILLGAWSSLVTPTHRGTYRPHI